MIDSIKVQIIEKRVKLVKPPIIHSFKLARDEYPDGDYYALNATSENLDLLARLSQISEGGGEGRDLFFDHILAFRPGKPITPLFDFHDAFVADQLRFTDLYTQKDSSEFAKRTNTRFSRELSE